MTRISYLDETWNPVTGCAGYGCATRETCWARALAKRFPNLHGATIPFSSVQRHPDRLDKPIRWRRPRRIGVCFQGDLFDDQVPNGWIEDVFNVIDLCRDHAFFLLTKQAKRMLAFSAWDPLKESEWPNLWWGVSCCTQADVDRMVPDLVRIPGKRWISLEPLLGPIKDFPLDHPMRTAFSQLDWVVVGCHSDPWRFPCELEWIHDVVIQCNLAEVPVYVKQVPIGTKCSRRPEDWPTFLAQREYPSGIPGTVSKLDAKNP